jgi:hypothetical protein
MAQAAGRPTSFNAALAEAICLKIADGQSLRAICEDEEYPNRSTVFRWLADPVQTEFRDQYARAREASAHADADDIAHYARQAATGRIEPAAATAAINGLKWSAGKRMPKAYGDKVAVVGGDKADAPIRHSHSFDLSAASDEELDVIERFIRRSANAGGDQGGEGASEG